MNQQTSKLLCTGLSFITYNPRHAKGLSIGRRLVVRVLLLHCHVCLRRIGIARLQLCACTKQSTERTQHTPHANCAGTVHITKDPA